MRASSAIPQFIDEAKSRGDDVFIMLEEGDTYHLNRINQGGDGEIRFFYGASRSSKACSTEVWSNARVRRSKNRLVMRDIDDEPLQIFAVPPKVKSPGLMETLEGVVTATEGEYVGRKFGLLTVTAMLGYRGRSRMSRCACECGGTKDAIVSQLRAGKVISCGCQRGLNNTAPIADGEKIGRLTILGRAARPEGNSRSGFF